MSSVILHKRVRPVSPRSWRPGLRSVVMVVLLAGALAAALYAYVQRPAQVFLPVRHVKVDGELHRVERDRLQAVVTAHLQPGLLQVDLPALRRALQEIAWVERATVRRLLPHTLLIGITEHTPVARWGKTQLLGRDGSVFEAGEAIAAHAGLPALAGPPRMQRELHAMYMRYAPWFRALGLQLARLELDRRRSWRVTLASGVEVVLGREATGQRLQRFATLTRGPLRHEWDNVQRIDLRYTNGVAVRWRDDVLHTASGRE